MYFSLQVLIVLTVVHDHPLTYLSYDFPPLSHSLGLIISLIPVLPVLIYAVWCVWKKDGSIKHVSDFFYFIFYFLEFLKGIIVQCML